MNVAGSPTYRRLVGLPANLLVLYSFPSHLRVRRSKSGASAGAPDGELLQYLCERQPCSIARTMKAPGDEEDGGKPHAFCLIILHNSGA